MIWFRELKILWSKALYNDRQKSVLGKWKQSLLAIAFALSLTFILISIKGENPFVIFFTIIQGATRNPESLNSTLLYYAMFILAGLAIIVAFRSGLFNIGVGGQMLISGVVIMILAVKTAWPWPVLIVIGMFAGAFAAAISGALKALFNIHEVVSSILINWIFFYLSQYLLDPSMPWVDSFGTTKTIASQSRMQMGESLVLPALLVTFCLLLGAIILFKTTKYGYALKTVGQNPDAARYSGIRVALQITLGMALSGFIAGALAAVNYLGKFGDMSQATSTSLPAIGFQGISVALIAFKSFFGLIPAAFFWAIITQGADYVPIVFPNVPGEVLQLMNGFIIYMIAISIIFLRFKPLKILWLLYLKLTSSEIKIERMKAKKASLAQRKLFVSHQTKINALDQSQELTNLKTLQVQKQALIKKIKVKDRVYGKKHHRPPWTQMFVRQVNGIWKWFNFEAYRQAIVTYEAKRNDHTSQNYEQYELLLTQIKVQKALLHKSLISKNKASYKNGLEIIKNEYYRREHAIHKLSMNNSIIGKWKIQYQLNKNKVRFFEEKYNLLKLEFKTNLKQATNAKVRQILKDKFQKQINKLRVETNKIKV